jgi:inosine-uridine nucleoside N-ribohydrolase
MNQKNSSLFRWICLAILILSLALILVYLPSGQRELVQFPQVTAGYAGLARFLNLDAYLGWFFLLRSLAFFISWITAFAVWLLYGRRSGQASPSVFLTSTVLALLPLLIYPGLGDQSPGLPEPWNTVLVILSLLLGFSAFPCLVLLYFLFPRGTFRPRWSRWLAASLMALLLLGIVFVFSSPDTILSALFQLALLLSLVVGIIFQSITFLRLPAPEKRQAAPVSFAILLLPIIFILPDFFPGSRQAALTLFSWFAMLLVLPLGVWIALGRFALWRDLRSPGASGWRFVLTTGVSLLLLLAPAVVIQAKNVEPIPPLVIEPLPTADQPRPVIIDTDMAPDDWMAILYMLQRPEIDLRAITVTGTGEAHCEPGVRHALGLVALSGHAPIPVACGREQPLQGNHAFPASWRSFVDDLAGLRLPEGSNPTPGSSATEILRQEITSSGEPPTILALGPLTNLAELVQKDPSLAGRFSVIAMGGAFEVLGNVGASEPSIDNQVAEWNIYVDPLALKIILDSGVPLTLVPLDATDDVRITLDFLRRLQANAFTPEAGFIRDLLAVQVAKITSGFYDFWDPLSAAILVDESLAVIRQGELVVSTQEGSTSGMTRLRSGGVPVRYASGAYDDRFYEDFLRTLNQP